MLTEYEPRQDFRLDGRIVLLTGAAGHLGCAIAHGLCQAGARVLLNGRNLSRLEELAALLRRQGYDAEPCAFDITDADATATAIARIAEGHGRLDGLVNNAYQGRTGTVETIDAGDFALACGLNLAAPFRLVQQALPLLRTAAQTAPGGAAIVNVASMYGTVSPDPRIYGSSGANNPPQYGASKAGMIQLSRYLACHLAPDGIRVNSVSPGPFPPAAIRQTNPEFHQALCGKVPMNRIGRPNELSGPVVFLLSPAASYITGANLPVDGGWTAW